MLNRITMKSRNKKTGAIPVTTTEHKSCPKACPLKNNGCYADGGPLAIVWNEITDKPGIGKTWSQLCATIKAMPAGQLWRHNQAGDLPHKKQVIDNIKLEKLVAANRGLKGFTYTHHDMTIYENREQVKKANEQGFAINLSANNLRQADEYKALNIGPVVVVVPINQVENIRTPVGHKVTICPAAIDATDTISCKTCKLCQVVNRETIIGFPAHGASKRKAENIATA